MSYWNFLQLAYKQSLKAYLQGEVPVGCALFSPDNQLIYADFNRNIALCDPTAHAELLVIKNAAKIIGNQRLNNTTLCVTLEPCLMCMGAIMHARVSRVIYAIKDYEHGFVSKMLEYESHVNHVPRIILDASSSKRCSHVLKRFFAQRRMQKTS